VTESTRELVIDKSSWGPGPWQSEPDRLEWRYRGTPCLIVRGPIGALCGYVAVPPGHPWHGVDYEKVDAPAHGGLTYSDRCQENGFVCHTPQEGEPAEVWWLGFDCAHANDLSPAYMALGARLRFQWQTYRDLAYVRREVERLADQALAAS
jgi:hypothetical protein